jgi:GntR family transcriptional regulator/MocR family aminotransferase
VVADAEQVVIVGGSQQALDLIARLQVGPGDAVAVEEPGYPEARHVFVAAGASLLPVEVDGDGLRVDQLVAHTAKAAPRLVYVTPSHQFPTGATLPLGRRLALLEWAGRHDVLVVEDDYDSEFHYSERPVASLQGLDRGGRVVYVGTFSTVLFPPLRVGYLVLPPDLVRPFVKAKWLADRQTPMLEQLALADFLAEGHFARHLRRMRRLAAERRGALLAAIAESFGPRAETSAAGTGMHIVLRLPARSHNGAAASAIETAIVRRAAALGLGVYPLSPCCIVPPSDPALLLGYAALSPARIREGVRRLAHAVKETLAEEK